MKLFCGLTLQHEEKHNKEWTMLLYMNQPNTTKT